MDNTNISNISPSYFRRHAVIKLIQLSVQIILGVLYFLMIITNQSVSAILFTNKPVFFLSVFMWLLLLTSFVGSFYDFYILQVNIQNAKILSRVAYLDSTTGIPNRNSCDDFIRLFKSPESIENVGCAVFTISNLSSINNSYGRDVGNESLKAVSTILEEVIESYGFVGRNGSNDFLAIISSCSKDKMDSILNEFSLALEHYNNNSRNISININTAYTLNEDLHANDIYDIIRTSYQKIFDH